MRAIFATILITVFLAGAKLQAADCGACKGLVGEQQAAQEDVLRLQALEKQNQKALDAAAGNVSVRVKIISNLMIIKTKIETGQNIAQAKQNAMDQMGCSTCPR